MGILFIHLLPHTVLHQFTCLPVAKQSPCKNKTVNEGSSCPVLCFKAVLWKVDKWSITHTPSTAVLVQTRTLYMNSDDSQSKPSACIISACLYSNPRVAVFFTDSSELHFPLPIMLEWQDRMCYKLPVLRINLKNTKQQQWRIRCRKGPWDVQKRETAAHLLIYFSGRLSGYGYMLWLHSCQGFFFLIFEHKKNKNTRASTNSLRLH